MTSSQLVNDLIQAGIHFGQRRSHWNPKMKPYIFGSRNKVHIIDIRETIKGLLTAKKFVRQTVADGKDVCFIGTKRQARGAIEQYASDVKMPWVTERWLGGTLTNFRTIRERLKRLIELEKLIESGEIETYSKKMAAQLLREKRKIHRNLAGIRDMNRLPGALFIVDVSREINALREAKTLNIPTIALIDTDGDPDVVDIPIPGNDDSMRSIEVVVRELCVAVTEGKSGRAEQSEAEAAEQAAQDSGDDAAGRRRSSRAQFRADEPASTDATEDEQAGTENQATGEQPGPTQRAVAPATAGSESRNE